MRRAGIKLPFQNTRKVNAERSRDAQGNRKLCAPKFTSRSRQQSGTWLDFMLVRFCFISSALSSNGGVLSICIDNLSVKEAINNINYVRALVGLDHVGLGPTASPKKYALLLAELARDRLWNNASLKKLVGGNIVRILREVSMSEHNSLHSVRLIAH